MGHIKLEEEIREKLEGREIQPSEGAWGKLSAQLEAPAKTSSTRKYWLAIAATFVGILVIVSAVRTISTSASEEITTEIVTVDTSEETPIKTPLKTQKETQILQQDLQKEVASEAVSEEKKTTNTVEVSPKVFQKKESIAVEKVVKQNPSEAPIKAKPSKVNNPMEAVAVNQLNSETKIINDNIQKVVAQVTQLQNENTVVTAEEIDALLINAQREIRTQQILSSSKIDAASLLDDVELELEHSFRDKVYDALGEGFHKIRTAVIERNN
ncbi:hypothetical protein [Ulvibacter litoralis]|uniref:Uncharacterized protein n=1 Tax=Ulvibacter litoralis TaxID=227084 RepID=A0A1G7GDP1_9FLAO|nr:hypothetical protein [Ulvibacter litoralis]GHC56626.1 hypothetical protein GCM10008083_21500 [Ulvibacter litoralis]SDE86246.1 hypothetical protein SAMN05421855_10370 [Ulvibacter litoralis]